MEARPFLRLLVRSGQGRIGRQAWWIVSARLSTLPMRSMNPGPSAVERHWLRLTLADRPAARRRVSVLLRARIPPIPPDLRDAFATYVAGVIAASLFFA
ncbi:MAG: hypothetical protein H5U21_03520 [Porphyrobacter sp.]|nr:hypothetical protein [Porphyrobacter sp.]